MPASRPPDNESLFALVRAWVAATFPGRSARRLTIRLDDGETVKVPVPTVEIRCTASGTTPPQDDEADHCQEDILNVLREVGHRLSTTQIMNEFASRDIEYSERTVSGKLSQMVQQGTLTNPKRNNRHTGYGLPDWD